MKLPLQALRYFPIIAVIIFSVVIFEWFTKPAKRINSIPQLEIQLTFRADSADQCDLFFDNGTGFDGKHRKSIKYGGSGFLQKISFLVPDSNLKSIRIDPYIHLSSIQIAAVEIFLDDHRQSLKGSDLIKSFRFQNCTAVLIESTNMVMVQSKTDADAQMLFTAPLPASNPGNEKTIFGSEWIKTLLPFLFMVLIIIALVHPLSASVDVGAAIGRIAAKFSKRNLIFILSILFAAIARLWLVADQSITALTHAQHDDALFIKLAQNILHNEWLGSYNQFTLIRGFFYPVWLALNWFTGLPLLSTQNLLMMAASLAVALTLKPWLGKSGAMLVFILLIFRPVTSSSFTLRIIRDGFYVTLSVLTFTAFAGLFVSGFASVNKLRMWALTSAVLLFLFWHTREEGPLLLPSLLLLWLSAVAMIYIRPKIKAAKSFNRKLIILIAPLVFSIAGSYFIGSLNQLYYGQFMVNEMKSPAFSEAFTALASIKTDHSALIIPVTKEAREKAYAVSPAFATLRSRLEDENNPFLTFTDKDTTDYTGGWFMYAFRQAASDAGKHQSLPMALNFYEQIGTDLEAAFADGRLKKNANLTLFFFTVNQEVLRPVVSVFPPTLWFALTFGGYGPVSEASTGDAQRIADFKEMTHETKTSEVGEKWNQSQLNSTQLRIRLLIQKAYQWFFPPLFFLAVLAFVFLTGRLFNKTKLNSLLPAWILSLSMLLAGLSRLVMISYMQVTQFNALNMHYLSTSYPFLLLFSSFTLIVVLNEIKSESDKNHAGHLQK